MERVRKCIWTFLMLGGVAIFAEPSQGQNLLVNPGFEDPITSDGPPFVGFWEAFQGGGASSARDTVDPRTGAGHLALAINNANNTFAGAFQDVAGLVAGQETVFSGWAKTTSLPYNLVTEIRIEWRNAGSNTEVSRTPNLLTAPTGAYGEFSLPATVPLGADTARVVYAIQSFTNEALPDLGTVYVDDASFVVVPEPSAAMALCAAGIVLGWRRRRTA